MFLEGGGEVEEGGSDAERTLQFTISRDENATLTRDIVVSFSTSDDSATGFLNSQSYSKIFMTTIFFLFLVPCHQLGLETMCQVLQF